MISTLNIEATAASGKRKRRDDALISSGKTVTPPEAGRTGAVLSMVGSVGSKLHDLVFVTLDALRGGYG